MFVCHGAGPSKMLGCTNIVFILLNYKCNLLSHNFIIAMSIDTTQKTDFDFLYIFGCQCNNCVDVYSTAEFCCRQKYSLRWEMALSEGKYGLFHSQQPWCNVWSIYKLSLYIHINIPQDHYLDKTKRIVLNTEVKSRSDVEVPWCHAQCSRIGGTIA